MDIDLLELAQKVKETPDDKILEYKFRLTAIREGKQELAHPLKVKDQVLITEDARETSSPWINGPWTGVVTKINEDKSMQVSPLGDLATIDFRVKPNDSYLKEGLYLTSDDITTVQLVSPALVD